MTTLDELQNLDDSQFHKLCDDLIRRFETRYRRLRTHGINQQGISIKGQPDSYIGETANSCTIAFCYTVQHKGWWTKIADDIRAAVAVSPEVKEIVVAIPHNSDRDGPKKKIDWRRATIAAAGKAELRIVDGREIADSLDRDCQDLRFEHLDIPYSRLNALSILTSCHRANKDAIVKLRASGRYDPERYAVRDADRKLFGLWQRALRPNVNARSSSHGPIRLIPLVNDAGIGKTSLLAAFVCSLGSGLPVILLQARDLSFASEDSLVAHIIHILQGVLKPEARLMEEAAIVHHLLGARLTVALDGLDEAKEADSVQRAITYWLGSRLGQASILIVSSRPEFWKLCVDRGWTKWIYNDVPDDRIPATTSRRTSIEYFDPTDGIRLPDRFNEDELETAWLRAGRLREQLYVLPSETREELRHPFTLRVYLDLCLSGNAPLGHTTRTELLEAWLNRRLDAEADKAERLTRQQFQQALRVVASRIAEFGVSSLAVETLVDVPRFDSVHPPGTVVERLITANILESMPDHEDYIRFAVEAVQDFYTANAEVETIVAAPVEMAKQFSNLPFTKAYPRLARIGQMLVDKEERHEFINHLANVDARMAAVVLRADAMKYTSEIRQNISDELGRQIGSRHRVRGAFAITLLSDLHCQEASHCLTTSLLAPAKPHLFLKNIGTTAFIKLGLVSGVELVYGWHWFRQEAYYFKDTLALVRGANISFKRALADYAWHRLDADSDTKEHGRAVCVLAYVGDERLASHLDERLTRNGSLHEYENRALIALGTDASGQVFYRSAKATLAQITKLGYQTGSLEWATLIDQISSSSSDLPHLITTQFEPYIGLLIDDDSEEAFFLGFNLMIRSRCAGLVYQGVVAWSRKYFGGFIDRERDWISPESWLDWWNRQTDAAIRKHLLKLIPNVVNGKIEDVLIDCLNDAGLRAQAAWHLGHFGCVRTAIYLRKLLASESNNLTSFDKENVALALGLLRDNSSIEPLRSLALAESKTETELFAVSALGLIGTPEAEIALNSLLGTDVDENHIGSALISCGSSSAVEKVIGLARSKYDGPKWLCKCLRRAFNKYCSRHVTEHYTHVFTRDLVVYLAENENSVVDKWDLVEALTEIDSEEVCDLLRQWASREGTVADPILRDSDHLTMSRLCYDELMNRGDVHAIPHYLEYRSDEKDTIYMFLAVENLSHFSAKAVAAELRNRLASVRNNSQVVRLLSLLGRFGAHGDEELICPFLDSSDYLIANVACESMLRLTDPMLVPENWREL